MIAELILLESEMSSSLRLGQLLRMVSTWVSCSVSLLPDRLSLFKVGLSSPQLSLSVSPDRLVQARLSSVSLVQPVSILSNRDNISPVRLSPVRPSHTWLVQSWWCRSPSPGGGRSGCCSLQGQTCYSPLGLFLQTCYGRTDDIRDRAHLQGEIFQEVAVSQEQLQTGNHQGGAAEVQELQPRHVEITLGEGGQVGHLRAEDGLLHGGPGQPQDGAAPGDDLPGYTGGDSADAHIQSPPQSLVLGHPAPFLADWQHYRG